MMSDYTPDRWVVVEMNSEHGKIRKILGSWYGGYAGSDSWRMNSGITEVIDQGQHYDVVGYSGSVYKCYKGSEGMSSYTERVFLDYKRQAEEANASMEIVNIIEGAEIHSDKEYELSTLEKQQEFEKKRNYNYEQK